MLTTRRAEIDERGLEAAAGTHQLAGFLADQVEGLGELDFVRVIPLAVPQDTIEVSRLEAGGYAVRVPPRPPDRPLSMAVRERLDDHGFPAIKPEVALGERVFPRSAEAAAAAATLLRDVFGHADAEPVDIRHGSRRQERDAARKLAELRQRIEPVVTEFLGRPPLLDSDGDYLVPHHGLTVVVAPRAAPSGVALVRVATITNLGIVPTPEVGALLANLNFGIAIGRFALDAEHRAIWFDETLLGDDLNPRSLALTIEVVAHTAADWADRLRQLFGGVTQGQAAADDGGFAGDTKRHNPGEGGYL
jgi:hypothetical protein